MHSNFLFVQLLNLKIMKSINKISMLLIIIGAFTITGCKAAINNTKTETFKIWGNCEMCEERIEEAAYKKNVSKGDWNKDTKLITITFDSTKTNSGEILKRIAYAGYDSEQFLAPDDVYANLPGCCQYTRPKKETVTTDQNTTTTTTEETTSTIVVNPMTDTYTTYFGLKEALTKDNSSSASTKAKDLLNALNGVKMESLEGDQHNAFMKHLPDLKSAAEKISKTTDIEKQREAFVSLSSHMYELMNVIKPETTVYYDFCPMYNDGQGAYWLSTESSIKNPYFGSSMLTCGKTKETIK